MIRRVLLALGVVPLSIVAFAACGSEVTTATGGSGGGGGGPGTGGAGTGGGAVCPATQPEVGQVCATNGLSCTYGTGCCPAQFQCTDYVWAQTIVECPNKTPVSCPADPPVAGTPCDDCFESGPCTYACPGTSASVTATCGGGAWQLDGTCPVPPPADCNGMSCKSGEICMQTEGGVGITYNCVADPCAPGPLSCDCAGALCGGSPYVCGVMGQTLVCSCPTCA